MFKGSPWTFNNHLLLLHKLQLTEDPLIVPLIYTPFWVQIHDIPAGFFSERLAIQLGNFIGTHMEYDGSNLEKENRNFMRIRVQIDVRYPLKRKKQILFLANVHMSNLDTNDYLFFTSIVGDWDIATHFVKRRWH